MNDKVRNTVVAGLAYMVFATGLTLHPALVQAAAIDGKVGERLAELLLTVDGDKARATPLKRLLDEAEQALTENRGNAERWYDLARVRFWYADTQSLFTALKQMKQVRVELETGMALDPAGGADEAMAFLGYLYGGMLPSPLGFRDRKKSEELLLRALDLRPESAANNYFYAYYLAATGQERKALGYLHEAQERLQAKPELSLREVRFLQGVNVLLARLEG